MGLCWGAADSDPPAVPFERHFEIFNDKLWIGIRNTLCWVEM
ncbi:hypothetical protein NC99_20260 [Sunxiuqinia dokdonensis]|uniref:Uncharacterized protein n=1 Tax=Sunxiuqinia dokdonensis TaxID=1409788 RepID=A0A0L8V9R7_9BACT|nr:hypothetical protein NC99_20260 [Sunxiuqinia dokdonensis]